MMKALDMCFAWKRALNEGFINASYFVIPAPKSLETKVKLKKHTPSHSISLIGLESILELKI
jgi:hypothetical protein